MPGERGGIQSLERAFAILEAIAAARDGISLAGLSKRLGLHTSTAFHLVQTLVALGYARQDGETKRYRIGRPLFTLAAAALDEVERVRIATPILEQLSAQTGESGHFGVWSGGSVAAPVHDFTGRMSGVIGVSGPVWRLSLQALQAMAAQVARAAGEMSRSLGNRTGD